MAKTTPKKDKSQGGNVIEIPPYETAEHPPAEIPEPVPPESTNGLPPETTIEETATKEQLDRTTGARGQRKESGLGFFARLPKHGPAEWERLKLYLYRLAPITDRTAGGNPVKFLTIYREAIDEEMVLKEWGSGKYRCLLNRMQEKGESIPIDRVEFEIENLKFPPKVPPGEWVDDPRNRRWAWGIEDDAKKNGAQAAPPAPPQGPSLGEIVTAVKTMSDMTRANQPAPPAKEESPFAKIDIVGLMKETQAANNPAAILAAAKEIAAISKPAATADPFELALKLAEVLKPATAPAAVDPVTQMKNYAEAAKAMKDAFGPGESETEAIKQSRMNGWQEFTTAIVSALAPGANKAMEMFANLTAMRMNQAQRAAQPANATPRPTAPAPIAQPGAQPQQGAPGTAPAQQQTEQTQQPEQQEQQPMNTQQQTGHAALHALDYSMPTLLEYLAKPDDFYDAPKGVVFAGWFCDTNMPTGLPLQPYAMGAVIHRNMRGVPASIVAKLIEQNAPGMYQALVPSSEKEAPFLKFLEEFLSYDPEADPEAEQESTK